MAADLLSLESDNRPGEVLLKLAMKAGRRLEPGPALSEVKDRTAYNLKRLPEPLRRLDPEASYPVKIADALQELARETDRRLARQDAGAS